MFHLGFVCLLPTAELAVCGQSVPGGRSRSNRPANSEQQRSRYQNSITRAQIGCARAKMAPYCCSNLARSIFAEWGLKIKANTRRGVFRVKNMAIDRALSRSDESCPRFEETS